MGSKGFGLLALAGVGAFFSANILSGPLLRDYRGVTRRVETNRGVFDVYRTYDGKETEVSYVNPRKTSVLVDTDGDLQLNETIYNMFKAGIQSSPEENTDFSTAVSYWPIGTPIGLNLFGGTDV